MRYLLDPEFRPVRLQEPSHPPVPYAALLRRELSERNLRWAVEHAFLHEVTLGSVPAVLYREDGAGRHGNFLPASYKCMRANSAWSRRLNKTHTSARRSLLSHDPNRRELDSSNSSDALLMNIFCHPATLSSNQVCRRLGIATGSQPVFGYKPRVPLLDGKKDCTEIDMKLDDLFLEAKLTENDFQQAPRRLIDRYNGLAEVFDLDRLSPDSESVPSYQLIRGILAAYASPDFRFCVLCDARRPDLIAHWQKLLHAVKLYDLRCRMVLLTWQELAEVLPRPVQTFLAVKYGINPACPLAPLSCTQKRALTHLIP